MQSGSPGAGEAPSVGRRLPRRALRAMAIVAAFVASLELGSYAALHLLRGSRVEQGLLLGRDRPVELTPDGRELNPNFSWMNDEALHPFVGYVRDTPPQNDQTHGFLTWFYPLQLRGPKEFRVALLGGSVAQRVSRALQSALVDELEARGIDRKVVLLQLAYPGFKQPQQLQTISYFLSLGAQFDVVVNVDGYNELALSITENDAAGVYPFFPRRWDERVAQTQDPKRLREIGRITALRDLQSGILSWTGNSPLRHSSTAQLSAELLLRATDVPIAAAQERLRNLPVSGAFEQHGPFRKYNDDRALMNAVVANWARSSQLLDRLADSIGAEYHHFLQPNQYVAGSKRLTDEERRTAYAPDEAPAKVIKEGFPILVDRGRRLRRKGILFHDATQIYANETESIYIDACCHFNEKGDEILARFIVDEIFATTRLPWLKPPGDTGGSDAPVEPDGEPTRRRRPGWLGQPRLGLESGLSVLEQKAIV